MRDQAKAGSGTVVHVTLAHLPHDVRIFEKEAVTLATAGYDVALVVPGASSTTEKGVRFVPLPPGASRRGVAAAFGRLSAAMGAVARLHPALVHLHDPELIPLGLVFALRGVPVIYDAHEDAPLEALTLNSHRPARGKALSAFWRVNLALASALMRGFVAATPDIARTLPRRRTVTVRNYPRVERLQPGPVPHAARPRRIAYVGNISRARGLMELLDAMAGLPDSDPAELILVGTFRPAALQAEAEQHPGWSRVRYRPWQDWSEITDLLDTCRLGVCALHPTPEMIRSLPVKLFEYLAKGLPVVASDFAEWRPLVGDAGLLVEPLDADALRSAIVRLLDDPALGESMGRNGVARVNADFSWDAEGERLVALYGRLIGPPQTFASRPVDLHKKVLS